MADDWRHLSSPNERLRWARIHAGHPSASDAAKTLGIADHTYRTYERSADQANGHWPRGPIVQRLAKKFDVDWTWLETGEGQPWLKDESRPPDDPPSPVSRVVISMAEASAARQEAIAEVVEALVRTDKGA